jgi:hypothetical protein
MNQEINPAKGKAGFLLAAVLTAGAFLATACGNNSQTTSAPSSATTTFTPTPAPITFNIKNSITTYAITQVSIIPYPTGSAYSFPMTVSSGASTLFNFELPNGVYYVAVYDSNGQFDEWSAVSLNSGSTYPVTVNSSTGTFNSTTCAPCGI